jgi:hypothetical protein
MEGICLGELVDRGVSNSSSSMSQEDRSEGHKRPDWDVFGVHERGKTCLKSR